MNNKFISEEYLCTLEQERHFLQSVLNHYVKNYSRNSQEIIDVLPEIRRQTAILSAKIEYLNHELRDIY